MGFWGNPLTHGAFSVPILSAPFHPRYCPVRSRDRSAVTFNAQTIGAVHAQILTNVKQAVMICLFLTKYLHKAALLCAGRDHYPLQSLEFQNFLEVFVLVVALTLLVTRFST